MGQQVFEEVILKNYQVLAFKSGNICFVSKHNVVYEYKIGDKIPREIFRFSLDLRALLSRWSVVLRRLLRTDIRYAIKLDSEYLVLIYKGKLHKIDFTRGILVSSTKVPRGSRPLNMVHIKGLKGFKPGVYFGEYFSNPRKLTVNIYEYVNDEFNVIYQFGENLINHIHNLVCDEYRNCVWILAGDFGNGAAIFKATDGFKKVERIVFGSQIYRSCVAFPIKEGLLYATDSQFCQNSIRLLTVQSGKWDSKVLYHINGSCIYGTMINNDYYFSTAVEAINSGNILRKYLRNKRGPGILKNQTEIVRFCADGRLSKIYTNKKDWLPFLLFQFGNIIFPSGENRSDKLFFTPIATKSNDFSTEILNLRE